MSNIPFEKIENNEAVIGIVGLGYVGIPLLLRFSECGYRVIGFDIDDTKVERLNNGESYIEHISADSISNALNSGFQATTRIESCSQCDAIIICVPTPLNKYREPDLSFVVGTMNEISPYLRQGQIVSLESTTYPGTTDEVLRPVIESRGFEIGKDVFLVYSPEREDPGNSSFETQTIPKICGGYTPTCLEMGLTLYSKVIDKVVPVSSTRAAEMTKLLENIHRAVNIGLVNEMKILADKMGIDIHEVIDAAATKPFGFTAYYPGPGLGGHCIPIDPFYLTWKAREYGMHTRFIELAGEINQAMPDYVINKVTQSLNDRKKSIHGSRILILGIAYKRNVDDMRESPSVLIMEKLRQLGADIQYSDPHVKHFPRMRQHFFELSSLPLSQESLEDFDAVIVATDHEAFDYDIIKKFSKLVIDTRGVYKNSFPTLVRA